MTPIPPNAPAQEGTCPCHCHQEKADGFKCKCLKKCPHCRPELYESTPSTPPSEGTWEERMTLKNQISLAKKNIYHFAATRLNADPTYESNKQDFYDEVGIEIQQCIDNALASQAKRLRGAMEAEAQQQRGMSGCGADVLYGFDECSKALLSAFDKALQDNP